MDRFISKTKVLATGKIRRIHKGMSTVEHFDKVATGDDEVYKSLYFKDREEIKIRKAIVRRPSNRYLYSRKKESKIFIPEVYYHVLWQNQNDIQFRMKMVRNLYECGHINIETAQYLLGDELKGFIEQKEQVQTQEDKRWDDWLSLVQECGLPQDHIANERVSASLLRDGWLFDEVTAEYPFTKAGPQLVKSNLTLRDVLRMLRPYWHQLAYPEWIIDVLGAHKGADNNFVTLIVLWIANLKRSVINDAVWASGMTYVRYDKWAQCTKLMSDYVRATDTFANMQITEDDKQLLMYWDCLYGRSGLTPDWEEHKQAVTTEPPEKECIAYERKEMCKTRWREVRDKTLSRMFKKIIDKVKPVTIQEYADNFISAKAGGSVSGFPTKVEASTVFRDGGQGQIRLGKPGYLEKANIVELINQKLEQVPNNHVVAAAKPEEMGPKARDLAASYFDDYLVADYIVSTFEEKIAEDEIDLGGVGDKNALDMLEKIKLSQKWYGIMGDYSKFNHSHRGEDIKAIFDVFAQEVADTYGRCELSTTAVWLGESLRNTHIHYPDGSVVVANHTLMSGWRVTSLVNTILNYCYLKGIEETMIYMYDAHPLVYARVKGDDIYALGGGWYDSVAFISAAKRMRLNLHPIKQLQSNSVGEYERITYVSDGQLRGSMCRGLCSLVTGNWIGGGQINPYEKVRALVEQVKMVRRRGMSRWLADLIMDALIKKWGRVIRDCEKVSIIFAPTGSGKTHYITENSERLRRDGIALIDGDEVFSWSAAGASTSTWQHTPQMFERLETGMHNIIMIHPVQLAYGLHKIPRVEVLPKREVWEWQYAARKRLMHAGTSTMKYEDVKEQLARRAIGEVHRYDNFDEAIEKLQMLGGARQLHLALEPRQIIISEGCGGLGLANEHLTAEVTIAKCPSIQPSGDMLRKDAPKELSKRMGNKFARQLAGKQLVFSGYERFVDDTAAAHYWTSLPEHQRWSLTSHTKDEVYEWVAMQYGMKNDIKEVNLQQPMPDKIKSIIDTIFTEQHLPKQKYAKERRQREYWQPMLKYITKSDGDPAKIEDIIYQPVALPENLQWQVILTAGVTLGLDHNMPGVFEGMIKRYVVEAVIDEYYYRQFSEADFELMLKKFMQDACKYIESKYARLMLF